MQQGNPYPERQPAGPSSRVADETKELARQGTEQVKAVSQTARQRALYEVNHGRERLADDIHQLASTLEGHADGGASQVAKLAASAAHSLSSTLRNRSAEDLLGAATRNPVAVLAGAFAVGFLSVRLFRA